MKIKKGPIGWGFFTTEAVEEGEMIIQVDRQDQITISNMTDALRDAQVGIETWKNLETKPDCLDTLTMFWLVEKSKGNLSHYHNYIKTLPTDYPTGKDEFFLNIIEFSRPF